MRFSFFATPWLYPDGLLQVLASLGHINKQSRSQSRIKSINNKQSMQIEEESKTQHLYCCRSHLWYQSVDYLHAHKRCGMNSHCRLQVSYLCHLLSVFQFFLLYMCKKAGIDISTIKIESSFHSLLYSKLPIALMHQQSSSFMKMLI